MAAIFLFCLYNGKKEKTIYKYNNVERKRENVSDTRVLLLLGGGWGCLGIQATHHTSVSRIFKKKQLVNNE